MIEVIISGPTHAFKCRRPVQVNNSSLSYRSSRGLLSETLDASTGIGALFINEAPHIGKAIADPEDYAEEISFFSETSKARLNEIKNLLNTDPESSTNRLSKFFYSRFEKVSTLISDIVFPNFSKTFVGSAFLRAETDVKFDLKDVLWFFEGILYANLREIVTWSEEPDYPAGTEIKAPYQFYPRPETVSTYIMKHQIEEKNKIKRTRVPTYRPTVTLTLDSRYPLGYPDLEKFLELLWADQMSGTQFSIKCGLLRELNKAEGIETDMPHSDNYELKFAAGDSFNRIKRVVLRNGQKYLDLLAEIEMVESAKKRLRDMTDCYFTTLGKIITAITSQKDLLSEKIKNLKNAKFMEIYGLISSRGIQLPAAALSHMSTKAGVSSAEFAKAEAIVISVLGDSARSSSANSNSSPSKSTTPKKASGSSGASGASSNTPVGLIDKRSHILVYYELMDPSDFIQAVEELFQTSVVLDDSAREILNLLISFASGPDYAEKNMLVEELSNFSDLKREEQKLYDKTGSIFKKAAKADGTNGVEGADSPNDTEKKEENLLIDETVLLTRWVNKILAEIGFRREDVINKIKNNNLAAPKDFRKFDLTTYKRVGKTVERVEKTADRVSILKSIVLSQSGINSVVVTYNLNPRPVFYADEGFGDGPTPHSMLQRNTVQIKDIFDKLRIEDEASVKIGFLEEWSRRHNYTLQFNYMGNNDYSHLDGLMSTAKKIDELFIIPPGITSTALYNKFCNIAKIGGDDESDSFFYTHYIVILFKCCIDSRFSVPIYHDLSGTSNANSAVPNATAAPEPASDYHSYTLLDSAQFLQELKELMEYVHKKINDQLPPVNNREPGFIYGVIAEEVYISFSKEEEVPIDTIFRSIFDQIIFPSGRANTPNCLNHFTFPPEYKEIELSLALPKSRPQPPGTAIKEPNQSAPAARSTPPTLQGAPPPVQLSVPPPIRSFSNLR
jgi:hypothetical protein